MGLLKIIFGSAKEYDEEKFEKEADKLGLSKKDRKRAKEEEMSPAEYIEAEERDDDNLDYDD